MTDEFGKYIEEKYRTNTINSVKTRVDKLINDPDKDQRHQAQLCPSCYYHEPGMSGQGFVSKDCDFCGVIMQFSTTDTTKLCKDCAVGTNTCINCASDIDLQPRPGNKYIYQATTSTCLGIDHLRNKWDRFQKDPHKDARVKDQVCKCCYYLRTRMAGRAMTRRNCGTCKVEVTYTSTATNEICKGCAALDNSCVQCRCSMQIPGE